MAPDRIEPTAFSALTGDADTPKAAWAPMEGDCLTNDRGRHRIIQTQGRWRVVRMAKGRSQPLEQELGFFNAIDEAMRFVEAQQAVIAISRGLANRMSAADRSLAVVELNARLSMIQDYRAEYGLDPGAHPGLDDLERSIRAQMRRVIPAPRMMSRVPKDARMASE